MQVLDASMHLAAAACWHPPKAALTPSMIASRWLKFRGVLCAHWCEMKGCRQLIKRPNHQRERQSPASYIFSERRVNFLWKPVGSSPSGRERDCKRNKIAFILLLATHFTLRDKNWALLMDLIALADLCSCLEAAVDILANNMMLILLFQVFWTLVRHHKSRMEACYVFLPLFFFFLHWSSWPKYTSVWWDSRTWLSRASIDRVMATKWMKFPFLF